MATDTAAGTADTGSAATSTDPVAGVGSGDAKGAAGATDQTGSGDNYIQRIRSDPDIAEREVKNQQARADREAAENARTKEWFGRLGSVRATHHGDQVMAAVEEYSSFLNSPEGARIHAEWKRTGQWPSTPDRDDGGDDYQDPGEERLRSIESESKDTSRVLARTSLDTHISKFFGEWDFSVDDQKRMIDRAKIVVNGWADTEAGRKSIRDLSGDNGENTTRTLLLSQVDTEKIHAASAASTLRRNQKLESFGTEGLSDLPSTGGEPPPDFASEEGSVKDVALKALTFAGDNPKRI